MTSALRARPRPPPLLQNRVVRAVTDGFKARAWLSLHRDEGLRDLPCGSAHAPCSPPHTQPTHLLPSLRAAPPRPTQNPNGCNVPATWFALKDKTNCTLVKQLLKDNHGGCWVPRGAVEWAETAPQCARGAPQRRSRARLAAAPGLPHPAPRPAPCSSSLLLLQRLPGTR